MQGLLYQDSRLEVTLFPGGDVNDLTCARVSGGWFGLRILDAEYTKPSNFDAISIDQALAHSLEESVDNLIGELLLDTQFV